MAKGKNYGTAFIVCFIIFVIWQVVQMAVKGLLVNIIFCMAIFGAWRGIVNSDSGEEPSGDGGQEQIAEESEQEVKEDEKN